MADETPRQTNTRVYEILDEIRADLATVKTDVAVTAAAQPRLMDIVEDHETRLRNVESGKATVESVTKLATVVDAVKAEQNRNSWLPRLAWAVLWLIVGGVAAAVLSQVLIT